MRVGLLLLAGCEPVEVYDEAGTWEPCAPLLAPLQEQAVVVLGGHVVMVGGIDPTRLASDRVEAWDPATDRWSPLPDLPVERHHVNAAVVDGVLFALGGLDAGFGPEGASFALRDDAWVPVAPIPPGRERGASAVGVVDGQIHLVGGVAGVDVPWHDVYDPSTDRWSTLPDAPLARDHGGGAVIDGVFYAVGGRHRSIDAHVGDLHGWSGGSWSERAPLPTTRGGIAVATLDRRLHVIGGEGAPGERSGVFDVHEAWDPATDHWSTLPPPAVPRHGTGAAAIDEVLVLPGGADVQAIGPSDACEIFRP